MADRNYTLGRGKVYFDAFLPNTKTKTGERYFGNTPAFAMTIASTSLDHFDADAGIKTKDDAVTLELNRTGSLTTDHISVENVSIFLLGADSIQAQAAQVGANEIIADVKKDRYYQLGASNANPSGVRKISNLVVEKGVTPLVLGTDYTVDLELARVYILPTSVTVVDGDDLEFTYDKAAVSRSRIITAANSTIDGALRFVATNPKGELRDYYMPYVRLSPNGEFQLKGDEWQQLSFNLEILKLSDSVESIYVDGRPYVPA